jgi:predicted ATPase
LETARPAADKSLPIRDALVRQVEGELRLKFAKPDPGAAETCFEDALAIVRRQEARALELRAGAGLAGLWLDQGRRTEAHEQRAPVYGWFTEGIDPPGIEDAKALLDELR